ncbi:MAG: hypothetical protein IJ677_04365 [Alphaproteobacteria bacterium]|nr:hypothetical protein [Alphaproteobacteria bacterium]
MTIVSEINRIKNNITGAYTALSAKGATMPETQNSANLATTVASVPAGGGDIVTAVNYTGGAIAQGEKVFLKENVAVEASTTNFSDYSGNNHNYINSSGSKILFGYSSSHHLYDISTETSSSVTVSIVHSSYPVRYDNKGNIFLKGYLFNEGITSFRYMVQDNYATTVFTGSSGTTATLTKLDNNFNEVKTWDYSWDTNLFYTITTVIGNKLYLSGCSSVASNNYGADYRYVGIIDENSNTITMTGGYMAQNPIVLYSTIDNKLAICGDIAKANYSYYSSIALYSIDENYNISSTPFVTSNPDLASLLSLSKIYIVFNRNTGILGLGSQEDDSNYGIFKYENGDFVTVSLILPSIKSYNKIVSVDNSLSKVVIFNSLYTLAQSAGGYKAIPYVSQLGSDVLTGVANEIAANGASFEATTILPEV